MRLAFRQPASLDLVRTFLADVVRIVRPQTAGGWVRGASTPLPHEGHGPSPELARTEWRLGEATLIQRVEGGDGNPRDGYGFNIAVDCTVPGVDGVARSVSLAGGSWEPRPSELCFCLGGFSAAEFLAARAAGNAHFDGDDTANPVWARENVEGLAAVGARDVARALAAEALGGKDQAWGASSRRVVRRTLIELTDDPAARLEEEAKLLRDDPTDLERLARVASGAVELPGWTAAAAGQVLAVMQPWAPTSAVRLGPVAQRWLEHPWWGAPGGNSLDGWSSVRRQRFKRGEGASANVLVPAGEPMPLSMVDVVDAVQKLLGVSDVAVFLRGLGPGVEQALEGQVVSLEQDGARVRGMAHRRQRGPEFEHRWTWLWTGNGLEGAVLVSRLAPPFDPTVWSVETHLCWLGDEAATGRFAKALLEGQPHVRVTPADSRA